MVAHCCDRLALPGMGNAKSERLTMKLKQFVRTLLAVVIASSACCSTLSAQTPVSPTVEQTQDGQTVSPNSPLLILVKGAAGENNSNRNSWRLKSGGLNSPSGNSGRFVQVGQSTSQSEADRDDSAKRSKKPNPCLRSNLLDSLYRARHLRRKCCKFNLVGPDVSASELNEWLKPVSARCVIINGASSSGPFVTALSGANRLVVTATKSGSEQNFARFGGFLSGTLQGQSADLDHDEEVSLLEAFLAAIRRPKSSIARTRDLRPSMHCSMTTAIKWERPATFTVVCGRPKHLNKASRSTVVSPRS